MEQLLDTNSKTEPQFNLGREIQPTRFLLEQKGYFSRTYSLLSIFERGIGIQPLCSDRLEDASDPHHIVTWDRVVSVISSERNQREFTLTTSPVSRSAVTQTQQTPSGAKNVQAVNHMQAVYLCSERNELITVLMQYVQAEASSSGLIKAKCTLDGDEAFLALGVSYLQMTLIGNEKKVERIGLNRVQSLFMEENKLTILFQSQDFDTFCFETVPLCQQFCEMLIKQVFFLFRYTLKPEPISFESFLGKLIKRDLPIVFQTECLICKWNGQMEKRLFYITEKSLYQANQQGTIHEKVFLLKDLKILFAAESHFLTKLTFKDSQSLNLVFTSQYERDQFISTLLTLRQIQLAGANFPTNMIYASEEHTIKGIDLLYTNSPAQAIEYELYLAKRLHELRDAEKKAIIANEIILNTNFTQIQKIETVYVKNILSELKSILVGDNPAEITIRWLNLFSVLLNSKVVFLEILECPDICSQLSCLLFTHNSQTNILLTLLLSQCLWNCIDHHTGTEGKTETIIKRQLISGKSSHDQTRIQKSSNLFFDKLSAYLLYYQAQFDPLEIEGVKPDGIIVFAIGTILKSIMQTRKSSTGKEELKAYLDLFLTQDQKLFDALQQQEQHLSEFELQKRVKNLDDPLIHKPIIHIFEKFSQLENSMVVQYYFSTFMSYALSLVSKGLIFEGPERGTQLRFVQDYLLTFTVQFIWHFQLICESKARPSAIINEQIKVSILLLSNMLCQNEKCIALLLKCLPRTLLDNPEVQIQPNYAILTGQVSQTIDEKVAKTWKLEDWQAFFGKIRNQDFVKKATEQWDTVTREELKAKMLTEVHKFMAARVIHNRVVKHQGATVSGEPDSKSTLVLPSHEFNRDNRVVTRYLNIKWNSQEFVVRYRSLDKLHLVHKYYLTKLLVEKGVDSKPTFSLQIERPEIFWHDLKSRFSSSFNRDEQLLILKTMCVLYRQSYTQLQDLKSMPYFLNLFEQEPYDHCRFILLQLMQITMDVEDKRIAEKNIKRFIKHDGMDVLIKLIRLQLHSDHVKDEGVLINYSNNVRLNKYFRQNSQVTCFGILSIKVMEIIFRQMNSLDDIPLSQNREFMLQPLSLATLTRILYLNNTDQTRVLLKFINTHLNNHFYFFNLKNTGMIEVLILLLSTPNKELALSVLERFQEVAFDYNSSFGGQNCGLKMGSFIANDLKMIQDDRERLQKLSLQGKNPKVSRTLCLLSESVFLRFLPVPLIKYFYETNEKSFLEVFNMDFHESPILVWNADMRLHLEQSISQHLQQYINETDDDAWDQAPIKKYSNIIAYEPIQEEVRCGRYYLRVWISQDKDSTTFFEIPPDEEDEFHKNLQTELKLCIHEEHFKNKERIIILMKAFLLSLQRFKKNRPSSLDEIKKIVIEASSYRGPDYNEVIKRIVNIGSRILFQVVKTGPEDYKDIFMKLGVEIILEVFDQILAKDPKEIDVDVNEGKTVVLLVQSFNMILDRDLSTVLDLPQNQRRRLLASVSRLMELTFKLLPLFYDRQLIPVDKQRASSIFNETQLISSQNSKPTVFDPLYASKQQDKVQVKPKAFDSVNSPSKARKLSSNALNNFEKCKEKRYRAAQYEKDRDLNYAADDLFKIALKTKDSYAIELICDTFRSISEMIKYLSKNPSLHPELIESGIIWKTFKALYFQLKRESSDYQNLKLAIRLYCQTLKHMLSFASNMVNQGSDLFPINNFQNQNECICSFWKCAKNLFARKMRSTLLHEFSLKSGEMHFPLQFNAKHFLQIFGVKEEMSAELVWNDSTRKEMLEVIECQLNTLDKDVFGKILSFKYEVERVELIVDEIYIKHYNNPSDTFRPKVADSFSNSILNCLKPLLKEEESISNLTDRQYEDAYNLVNAIKMVLFREPGLQLHSSQLLFDDYITTLSQMIQLSPKDLEQENPSTQSRLANLSELVIDILTHFTLRKGPYIKLLLENNQFNRLLIRALYGPEQALIKLDRIVLLYEIILTSKEVEPSNFLIASGHIFFIIHNIFAQKNGMLERVELMRILLHFNYATERIYSCFIPSKFFLEFFAHHKELFLQTPLFINQNPQQPTIMPTLKNEPEQGGITGTRQSVGKNAQLVATNSSSNSQGAILSQLEKVMIQREKIANFLKKQFDAQKFESAFIIWKSEFREQCSARVESNCQQIVQSYDDSNFQVQWDLAPLQNPYLQREIRIKDVIIRIYNQNPQVYIKEKLNNFILEISTELYQVALQLFNLCRTNKDDEIESSTALSSKFQALCLKSQLLLTAFLLTLEQLLFNDQNPNRLIFATSAKKDFEGKRGGFSGASENRLQKQIIDKFTDSIQLDEKVFQHVTFWLQQQVFMTQFKQMPDSIRITFLQVIQLILEVDNSIKVLLDSQTLVSFINDSVIGIIQGKFKTAIEEYLILAIIHKLIPKENKIIPLLALKPQSSKDSDANPRSREASPRSALVKSALAGGDAATTNHHQLSTMENLLRILSEKKGEQHVQIIEIILQLMASNVMYQEHVKLTIKQNQPRLSIDPKILETRHEKLEEQIRHMWRGRSAKNQDPVQYHFDTCMKIEDKLQEKAMDKLKLPLLSKRSIYALTEEELRLLDRDEGVAQIQSKSIFSDI